MRAHYARWLARHGSQQETDELYEQTLDVARQALQIAPKNPDIWNTISPLAWEFYRSRNWDGAESMAWLGIERAEGAPEFLFHFTPLLLLADRRDEYRQICSPLIDACARGIELPSYRMRLPPQNAVIRMVGLDPESAGQADRVLQMARDTAELPPVGGLESIPLYTVGRACYRAGMFAEAVEWLQRALEKAKGRVTKYVIALDLALAYHYWGRVEDARDSFEKATDLLDEDPSFIPGHHRAEIEVLRNEAESLIRSRPSPTTASLNSRRY